MRCIFILEEYYEVKTYYGWFRMDQGAYQDYLAGKLWVTWVPVGAWKRPIEKQNPPALPADLSQEAVQLRERAARQGVFELLKEMFMGKEVPIPYKSRMSSCPIDEMALSVRSSNGLMRAGAGTFGKLHALMREKGLRSVRNLGQKSEREIIQSFFLACYGRLTPFEQARFWQELTRQIEAKT